MEVSFFSNIFFCFPTQNQLPQIIIGMVQSDALWNSISRDSKSNKNIEKISQCQKNRFEIFDFAFSFELVKLVKSNLNVCNKKNWSFRLKLIFFLDE